MKLRTRIKRANEARTQRADMLLAKIAVGNDTGLGDDVVLAILRAKNGPWTEYKSVEDLLADIGTKE